VRGCWVVGGDREGNMLPRNLQFPPCNPAMTPVSGTLSGASSFRSFLRQGPPLMLRPKRKLTTIATRTGTGSSPATRSPSPPLTPRLISELRLSEE